MSKNRKKLSEEKVEEKAEKDWSTSTLTDKEVEKIKKKSKRNMNPRSLENLAQYRKRTTEGKKKSLENLRPVKSKSEVDKADVVEAPEHNLVTKMMPVGEILEEEEQQVYENYLNAFLSDFKVDELSQSDMDDIIQLSVNKVIEFRLLRSARNDPKSLLDMTQAVERVRKYNDKIKESLAARRKDRIIPRGMDGVSIVDLAAAFDGERKRQAEVEEAELLQEEKDFLDNREFKGNREDEDVQMELNELENEKRAIIPEF